MEKLTAGETTINGIRFDIIDFTMDSELEYDFRIIQHGTAGGHPCIDGVCEGDLDFCTAWIARKTDKNSRATIKITYSDGYQELRKIDILNYGILFNSYLTLPKFKKCEIVPMVDIRQLECEITSVLEIGYI